MSFLRSIKDRFCPPARSTATTAKERLQIVISNERLKRDQIDFLPNLQMDLVNVIAKYFNVDLDQIKEQIKVDLESNNGQSVLELNITLPDASLDEL